MSRVFGHMRRGLTSIEVVIGVSIAGIALVYCAYSIMQFINTARDITEKTAALYLAEDGLELMRYMRDNDWNRIGSLPVNTTRYLEVTNAVVRATTTPEVIDGFRRSFTLQNVYRNATTDDIVASTTSGSVADTNSKYVTMLVSWGTPTTSVSLTTILADIAP